MKKLILGLLLICSINILVASSSSASNSTPLSVIPANFTYIENGKTSYSPNLIKMVILAIEEEMTGCHCSQSKCSFTIADAENPEARKKYLEQIEKDRNNEMIDPNSKLTPNFITATHIVKGIITRDYGCVTLNLWIEDLKGCIVAQKQISVSDIKNHVWEKIFDLSKVAGASLCQQMCLNRANGQNKQTCSKLRKPKVPSKCKERYFTIKTTTSYKSQSSKTFADKGSLHSSASSSASSKQIMRIDPKKGVVEIIGIKAEAKNSSEGEHDEFDLKSCSIVHKKGKTRVDDNPNDSLAHIGKHNIFNANSSNAFIEISVRNSNFVKRFRVPWSSLKSNGSWSGSGSKSKFDEPSAKDKEMENKIKNTEVYGKLMSGLEAAKAFTPEWRDDIKKGTDTIGLQGEKKCKTVYGLDLILGAEKVNRTFNAKININITPASKSDIDEFKLQRDIGESSSIRARKIELSKYEKEPNGIFGNLENSMYDSLSQKEQNGWNKVEKEAKKRADAKQQEEQNKKDVKEFDNLSLDDLEMFTE